jgi:hypothetical protein
MLIEPYFALPKKLPLIGGDWGPWVTNHLSKDQKIQVFVLFIISLILIFIFGTWAYYDDKKRKENPPPPKVEEPSKNYGEEGYGLGDFFNISKFIDLPSLGVGMFAGIIFGFIDNGGLWFGMDSLDPIFNADKVPWVYGYGGRRQYSGFGGKYDSAVFKDGVLSDKEKVRIDKLCKSVDDAYIKKLNSINHSKLTEKEKRKAKESYEVNEAAYADPHSEMFLGNNMSKSEYFKKFKKHEINEELYDVYVKNYRKYLDGSELPTTKKQARMMHSLTRGEKTQKLKYKKELKTLKSKGLPFSSKSRRNRHRIEELKYLIKQKRVWPGKNKKLAKACTQGYKFGTLTNAGLGNTFSDTLGAFLATFAGVLIVNMSGIDNVSLISEAIGITIGCLIGILIPRTLLKPLTYKT